MTAESTSRPIAGQFDVVIVGAGFAGLYMLHRVRGMGFSARVIEAGDGVGGTWYWNRYPGARCDVESMEYSYQFSDDLQQQWKWSERYAAQPELLRYADHVADRYDLRRDIQFDTRVTAAAFDESASRWRVETGGGAPIVAQHLVMATGCLSSANLPNFKSRDSFAGPTYHTGRWPHEGVDFTGRRVGIIGTGSSAVQSIPIIAAQAKHLTVFQRTPSYAVPARNGPIDPVLERDIKADYPAFRERAKRNRNGIHVPVNEAKAADASPTERERMFRERWQRGGLSYTGAFSDILLDKASNDAAADFIRARIREAVRDPATAELLSPKTVVGCKRMCIDTGYYETYNRPNVTLVDVSLAPIDEITPTGLDTGGRHYELDAIVFATGFDAMTGALLKVDIRGRGGLSLRDKWAAGPRTLLGVATAGFPNLFTVTGPGSPSVLTNMLPTIEQHVDWIAGVIGYLRDKRLAQIDATVAAEDAWVATVNEIADGTLFPTCNSWYLGANVPGKPRVFMPYIGFPSYVETCNEIAASGYRGFALG